jgi:hypothetical protein
VEDHATRAYVFLALDHEDDDGEREIRILFEDHMVCVADGTVSFDEYEGPSTFEDIVRNHQDPCMGWEEVPCF